MGKTSKIIYAIGDIHADKQAAVDAFRLAGLCDNNETWIAENVIVVQTGDLTDRGPDGKNTLELFRKWEQEAKQKNSELILLMGNHEAMNVQGDWRYVSQKDVQSFGSLEERKKAFVAGGEWHNWILQRDVVALVDGNLFLHGGLSEIFSDISIEDINNRVHQALITKPSDPILGEQGPLWYRGYLLKEENEACGELDRVLKKYKAQRMIVGHTTQRSGEVAVRCEGKLIGIDTGISKHYGSSTSILEINQNDAKAIYPNKIRDVKDP
jgi:hypothetical protein